MEKNTTITIVVVGLLILAGLGVWYWMANTSANPATSYNSNPASSTTPSNITTGATNTTTANGNKNQTKGTLYFTLTDAAVDMKNVTAVNMTVDQVQAYNKVNGWVTLSQKPLTFNLLDLKAKHEVAVLAGVAVPADTYNQFKLHIAKVTVMASGVIKTTMMPSGDFTIKTDVIVNPNTNSTVQFDVMADKSLHVASDGTYVFTPVVTFDSRENASVTVSVDNNISSSNGQTNASVHAGMDVDGTIKTDFMVDANAKLNITGGVIKVDSVTKVLLP